MSATTTSELTARDAVDISAALDARAEWCEGQAKWSRDSAARNAAHGYPTAAALDQQDADGYQADAYRLRALSERVISSQAITITEGTDR